MKLNRRSKKNNKDNLDNIKSASTQTSSIKQHQSTGDAESHNQSNQSQNNAYGSIAEGDVDMNTNTNTHTNINMSMSMSTRTSSAGKMKHFAITAILSTCFSYSCMMTTFFILTGPIECQRIEDETRKYYSYTVSKSIALGGFAVLAGLAQLITPLIGLLSDCYVPNDKFSGLHHLGKRMPYLIFGTVLVVIGSLGQIWASSPIHPATNNYLDPPGSHPHHTDGSTKVAFCGAWLHYSMFFLLTMFGTNIVYTITIVLIPDLVPPSQTGMANGTLALLIMSGSLFGFFSFDILLDNNVMDMYKVYIVTAVLASILTCTYVLEREDAMNKISSAQNHVVDVRSCNSSEHDHDEHDTTNNDKEDHEMGEPPLVLPVSVTSTTADIVIDNCTRTTTNQTKAEKDEYLPPLHILIYLLLYKPIMNKTRAEMISAYWIDTTEYRDFFIVTISRFFYYMGISSQTFFLYFIHDALRQSKHTSNPEAAVALLALVGQASGAITCYPVGILSDQYMNGRRKPFVYSACLLLSVGNIGLLMCKTLKQMICVCALLGASNGMYLTMDTSLAVDTLDIDESELVDEDEDNDGGISKEKNKNDDNDDAGEGEKVLLVERRIAGTDDNGSGNDHGTAQLLGIWGVFGFIGSALGPLIGGTALLALGQIASTTTSTTTTTTTIAQESFEYDDDDSAAAAAFPSSPFYNMKGYEALFSLSAFYFFCSALSLAFVRKKGV